MKSQIAATHKSGDSITIKYERDDVEWAIKLMQKCGFVEFTIRHDATDVALEGLGAKDD